MPVCKLTKYDLRMVIDCLKVVWTYLCTGNLISQFCKKSVLIPVCLNSLNFIRFVIKVASFDVECLHLL